jgi:hypothetical protein
MTTYTAVHRLPALSLLATALLIVLAACGAAPVGQPAPTAGAAHSDSAADHSGLEEMPHLHGLAFSPDGRQLIAPAHSGLRTYEDGVWYTPGVPAHDYMGFAPAEDGFYSSGHPAPGSSLTNPLGLVKSTDGGATLQNLGFVGESDFHTMGVGYRSHAIYLVNSAPNATLQAGPYYSLDRGKTWQPFAGRGVSAAPYAIAVHPDEPGTLALPTDAGLVQSADYGASFTLVGQAEPVTAAAYSLDGKRLLFGSKTLTALDLTSGEATPLKAPELGAEDVFTYIATSPTATDTLAVATLERDVFLSLDGGATWEQIADNGLEPAAAAQP